VDGIAVAFGPMSVKISEAMSNLPNMPASSKSCNEDIVERIYSGPKGNILSAFVA